jgi:hypothetical protein
MSTLVNAQLHLETIPDGITILSRYIRISQALQYYPFGKSNLYERMARGDFKSFLLKAPGSLRGIRLIDRHSIDQFLE